jgi:hypothetical protein
LEAQPEGPVIIPVSTAEKIESFSDLQEGWDYGVGAVVEQTTISAAQTWNRLLTMIGFETDASPGADGEIAIGGSRGPYYMELIAEADQTTSVAYDFKGMQEYYRLNQPTIDVLSSVLDVAGEIWNASTWYTQENTISRNISGFGPPSGITRGPYQYFPVNASNSMIAENANTFGYITDTSNISAVNLQSSGGLRRVISPPAHGSALMGHPKTATSSSKG